MRTVDACVEAGPLQNVGEACVVQQKFNKAMEHFQNALQEFTSVENKADQAESLLLSGEAHIARQEYREAIILLKQAISNAQSISARELVVRCSRALGSAMMHVDSAEAREHLSRALLLAEEYSMKLERQNIHRELASYYRMVGESTEALSHFEKFHALQQENLAENADRHLKDSLSMKLLNPLQKMNNVNNDWEELTKKFLSAHRQLAKRLLEVAPTLALREFQICILLRLSMNARQIADILDVTPRNIFNHQQNIRRKLSLHNRESLKTYLIRLCATDDEGKGDDKGPISDDDNPTM